MTVAAATDNGVHEITKNYKHDFIEKCYLLSYIVLNKNYHITLGTSSCL